MQTVESILVYSSTSLGGAIGFSHFQSSQTTQSFRLSMKPISSGQRTLLAGSLRLSQDDGIAHKTQQPKYFMDWFKCRCCHCTCYPRSIQYHTP